MHINYDLARQIGYIQAAAQEIQADMEKGHSQSSLSAEIDDIVEKYRWHRDTRTPTPTELPNGRMGRLQFINLLKDEIQLKALVNMIERYSGSEEDERYILDAMQRMNGLSWLFNTPMEENPMAEPNSARPDSRKSSLGSRKANSPMRKPRSNSPRPDIKKSDSLKLGSQRSNSLMRKPRRSNSIASTSSFGSTDTGLSHPPSKRRSMKILADTTYTDLFRNSPL